jgi:hypothetical protein
MRFPDIHCLAAAFWIVTACTAPAAGNDTPIFFTNATAVANGRTVLAAVLSGDAQSKTNVQALLGAAVVFVGGGSSALGVNANLTLCSNVVVDVEIQPPRDVRPQAAGWNAEVLGTLKRVDFRKRIIYIRARPERWKERWAI